ncbi:MAG: hypothetical protein Crog3KO_07670 [Crocinitomicaceae bacterium]
MSENLRINKQETQGHSNLKRKRNWKGPWMKLWDRSQIAQTEKKDQKKYSGVQNHAS